MIKSVSFQRNSVLPPWLTVSSAVQFVLIATLFILPFVPDEKLVRLKLQWFEIGVFCACALWFIGAALHARFDMRLSAIHVPVFLYVAYITLAYMFHHNRPVAVMELRRMVLCTAVFMVSSQYISSVKIQKRLMLVWLCGAGLISLYGILQHTGGVSILDVPRMDRVMGTFGNPIFFAAHLIMAVPIIGALLSDRKHIARTTLLLLILAAIMTALWYTRTRAAFIAVCLGGIIWMIINDYQKSWRGMRWCLRMKWIILGCAGGMLVMHGLLVTYHPAYRARSESFKGSIHYLIHRHQAHTVIWHDTVRMWLSAPFLGKGAGTFHIHFPEYASERLKRIWPQHDFIVNDAHNEFLQILAETGLVGFGIFMGIIVVFYRSAARHIFRTSSGNGETDDPAWFLGIAVSVTMLLIQNFFSVDMRFIISSAMLFLMVGMISSLEGKKISFSWQNQPVMRAAVCSAVIGFIGASGYYLVKPYAMQRKLVREPDFFEQENKNLPRNITDFERIAWDYAKRKDWNRAIENYKKAIDSNPQLAGAYNNLGNIYFTVGKRREAAVYYEQAIAINPALADAHMNLGICYYYEGQLKQSAEHMKRVLEIQPNNAKARDLLRRMVE